MAARPVGAGEAETRATIIFGSDEMANSQQISNSLSRLGVFLEKRRDGKKILLIGYTYRWRFKLWNLVNGGSLRIKHWASTLPTYLRWIPIPTARFFVIELLDVTKLKECFEILSPMGLFAVHVFSSSLESKVLAEVLVNKEESEITCLVNDGSRVSWTANMDDPRSETGLMEEWGLGEELTQSEVHELKGS